MRSVFCGVLLMVLMMFGTASAHVTEYLNDGDLILCGMHQGTAWYIDKSSVRIEEKNAPSCIISFQLFRAQYELNTGKITRVFDATVEKYLYNVKEHEMHHWNGSEWHYISPVGDRTETGSEFSGEMAYYIAYHKGFYGGRLWSDRRTGKNMAPPFGSELYERIDNSY